MTFKISRSHSAIVIDAIEETLTDGSEVSAGFLVLDDFAQLEDLRAHIDAYIANHK